MFRGIVYKLWLVLCLLIGSTLFMAFAIGRGHYFLLLIGGGGLCLSIVFVFRLYRSNTRKITFMFNAIENNDYAFRFSASEGLLTDELFNMALNRIKELLVEAKDKTIERERYYALILDRVTTGVAVVNGRGNVVQTNAGAMRLLGLSVFTHLNQLERLEEGLTALFNSVEAGGRRTVALHHERGVSNLSVQCSEAVIHGETLRIFALNNIDQELGDQELESWTRLTRVLTHEIMNTVTPIISLSDTLLRMHKGRRDDTFRGLEAIHNTGKGLLSFVESYRNFTRIPMPEMTLIDLRAFLERLVVLLCEEIGEHRIRVELCVEPPELILYADEHQITQVILNLMKNAVVAIGSRSEGYIRVSACCNEEQEVIVDVENNGDPIGEELATHIFVPFFTTKEHGSGIGLSISRQIMRLHRGTITLESSSESCTRFRLIFR